MDNPWDDLDANPVEDMLDLYEEFIKSGMKPAEYYFPPLLERMIEDYVPPNIRTRRGLHHG